LIVSGIVTAPLPLEQSYLVMVIVRYLLCNCIGLHRAGSVNNSSSVRSVAARATLKEPLSPDARVRPVFPSGSAHRRTPSPMRNLAQASIANSRSP